MIDVPPGQTVDLGGANSVAIGVPSGADRPEVFLVKNDGSQKDARVEAGRVKVIVSGGGLRTLLNVGHCTVKYESPAPPLTADAVVVANF